MIEQDTIRLLRECDAGAKMGISSIDDVLKYVRSPSLKRLLSDSRADHQTLSAEIRGHLDRFGDEGKDPPAVAETMSRMKTDMKLIMHESDHTIAELMTDGCGMGVKSLNKYLNQYEAASERAKDITKRLINLEEKLAVDIRQYL